MQPQARMGNPALLLPEAMQALQALARLIIAIANINVWNRLNAAVRQPAGEYKG